MTICCSHVDWQNVEFAKEPLWISVKEVFSTDCCFHFRVSTFTFTFWSTMAGLLAWTVRPHAFAATSGLGHDLGALHQVPPHTPHTPPPPHHPIPTWNRPSLSMSNVSIQKYGLEYTKRSKVTRPSKMEVRYLQVPFIYKNPCGNILTRLSYKSIR